MPVLLPNGVCFFKVNLSEEGAASKPLGYSNGIVYCGVAESDGLWVNVIVNAKAALGAKRCVTTRHVPSCFGTTPRPEQWKGWNGGWGNGPAMQPELHSFFR